MNETFTITELSRELGLTTRAIRHYEDKGLLRPQRRGRMRIYTPQDRVRLRLIQRGRRLGFPLDEIGEILGMYDGGRGESQQLSYVCEKIHEGRALLLRQLEDIKITLQEMDALEAECLTQLGRLEDA